MDGTERSEGRFMWFPSHHGLGGLCQQHAERAKWEPAGAGESGVNSGERRQGRREGGIRGAGPVCEDSWRGMLECKKEGR